MHSFQPLAETLQSLLLTPRTGLLLVLLAAAAVIDVRTYRVPNALTVGGMLAGLIASTLSAASAGSGALLALGGLALGMFALMPLHMLRALGAGDVKLMAAVGAFLGPHDTISALVFVLAFGGLLAVAVAVARGTSRRAVANVGAMFRTSATAVLPGTERVRPPVTSAGRIPYAVCIAVGTTAFLLVQQILSA